MAPTSFDIFDLNDCFAVDEPPVHRAGAQSVGFTNDAFAVDEDPTNRASSSPEIVMPHFLLETSATSEYDHQKPIPFCNERSPNLWDPRMIVDLALNIDPLESILECYGLDLPAYDHLCTVPTFRRELATAMRDLRENGLSFAKKAALQAETYLIDADEMVQDKSIPASTRLSVIQWMAKMGRLEPKEEKADAGGANGTTVNLQINFAR